MLASKVATIRAAAGRPRGHYRRRSSLSAKVPRKRTFLVQISKQDAGVAPDKQSAVALNQGGGSWGSGSGGCGSGGHGSGGCGGADGSRSSALLLVGAIALIMGASNMGSGEARSPALNTLAMLTASSAAGGMLEFVNDDTGGVCLGYADQGMEAREIFWVPNVAGSFAVEQHELPFLAPKQFHVREAVYVH